MLGLFDSGLGGLTVLRRVRALLPDQDLIYLADQAHVPYGDRDDDDLAGLLADNLHYLETAGAGAIVMGCNTSCAVAARRGWPAGGVPVFDLIANVARAVAARPVRRVGVLATAATARSGAYGAALRAARADLHVQEAGAPKLVPLVESGLLAGPIVRAAIEEALEAFTLPLDVLVLACTHYPLLEAEIRAVAGSSVALVDPAFAQADAVVAAVRAGNYPAGSGRATFVTTGPLEPYRRAIESIAGPLRPDDRVERARIARVRSA